LTGSIVQLAATPAADSALAGWTVSDRITGRILCSGPTCTVVMLGDRVVTAHFARVYTLGLELRGVGAFFQGGEVDSTDGKIHCRVPSDATSVCSASYLDGSVVSLHAEPDKDGHSFFAGYTNDCTGTNSKDCTVVMNSDKTVGMLWGGGACGAADDGLGPKDCGGGSNPGGY
jgi:hypothetical protein